MATTIAPFVLQVTNADGSLRTHDFNGHPIYYISPDSLCFCATCANDPTFDGMPREIDSFSRRHAATPMLCDDCHGLLLPDTTPTATLDEITNINQALVALIPYAKAHLPHIFVDATCSGHSKHAPDAHFAAAAQKATLGVPLAVDYSIAVAIARLLYAKHDLTSTDA